MSAPSGNDRRERPPNILYIHSHDTGRYVQPYGYQVPTPNIQLLADQGVLFREAFCAAPTCSGSRASPADRPVLPQQRHARARPPRLVAERLRPAPRPPAARRRLPLGADRRAAHLPRTPRVIGYDDVIEVDTNDAGDVAPIAIDDHARLRREPFFLSVGFFETHRQFSAPTSVRDTLYSLPPPNLPDTPRTRQDMAAFKASARSLDQGIGAVLNGLHEHGLAERTLIICTTDHGLAFPGAKATLFDRGIGVMLLMRGPGGFTGGKVFDAHGHPPRRLPDDLRPGGHRAPALAAGRLADAAGSRRDRPPPRRDLRRDDLPRRLRAAAGGPDRALEVHPPVRRLPVIRCSPTATTAPARTCSSSTAGRSSWSPEEQLYDLVFDPSEARNVAGDPATWKCWHRCASGSTTGWRRPTTRCWRARSSRRPAPSSTSRISARPGTRCEASARIP